MRDSSSKRCFVPRAAELLAGLAVVLGLLTALPAQAQNEWGASYITPFPDNDVYRLQVIGDGMAQGLFGALSDAFRSDTRVRMPDRLRSVSGLIRMRPDDFFRLEETIKSEPLHIAVVLLGISDRVALRAPDGRRVNVGSEEWKEEYGRRVDRVTRALKRHGSAIYWIGLPIVGRSEMNEDVRMLNAVLRERALLNNIKFIDVYEAFADETGQYTQYGPDLTGKQRLLRAGDGISFTAVGNRKLAHYVEREIKRDLIQAKNERNIPLAGSEAEQRRISPKAQNAEPAETVREAQQDSAAGRPKAGDGLFLRTGPPAGELEAENSTVSINLPGRSGRAEELKVEILRPAIPASVIALVSRRQSASRPVQLGDTLAETLPGGVTLLSSITPGLAAGSQAQRRRLAPTQSPFFKVLVKGERIPPQPGRADDFSWPPPQPDRKPGKADARPSNTIPLPVPNPRG